MPSVTVRLPGDLHEALLAECEHRGEKISDLVRSAVEEFLSTGPRERRAPTLTQVLAAEVNTAEHPLGAKLRDAARKAPALAREPLQAPDGRRPGAESGRTNPKGRESRPADSAKAAVPLIKSRAGWGGVENKRAPVCPVCEKRHFGVEHVKG